MWVYVGRVRIITIKNNVLLIYLFIYFYIVIHLSNYLFVDFFFLAYLIRLTPTFCTYVQLSSSEKSVFTLRSIYIIRFAFSPPSKLYPQRSYDTFMTLNLLFDRSRLLVSQHGHRGLWGQCEDSDPRRPAGNPLPPHHRKGDAQPLRELYLLTHVCETQLLHPHRGQGWVWRVCMHAETMSGMRCLCGRVSWIVKPRKGLVEVRRFESLPCAAAWHQEGQI